MAAAIDGVDVEVDDVLVVNVLGGEDVVLELEDCRNSNQSEQNKSPLVTGTGTYDSPSDIGECELRRVVRLNRCVREFKSIWTSRKDR